jgi:hypothetical protein
MTSPATTPSSSRTRRPPYGGPKVDKAAYVAALDAFAKGGGQLVLTDRAVGLLDDMGVVRADALTVNRTEPGTSTSSPRWATTRTRGAGRQAEPDLLRGHARLPLPGAVSQLRRACARRGRRPAAPASRLSGAERRLPNTALGHLDRGKGRLTIFGAILPQAIESLPDVETPHPHGSRRTPSPSPADRSSTTSSRTAGRADVARHGTAPACPPRRSVRPASGCRPRLVVLCLGAAWRSVRRRSSGVARDADLEPWARKAVRQAPRPSRSPAVSTQTASGSGRGRGARHSALSPCMTAVAA